MFWRFWSASVLANLGDGIRLAAFPLLAASLTSSPVGVALVAAAQTVPWLVGGLPAGVLADRRGARGLLAGADTVRVAVLAVLVCAVVLGWATIGLAIGASVVLGLCETVRDTAASTALPALVPAAELERANGRLAAGSIVGNEFAGPPLGAVLFGVGAALPFLANGAALSLAVLLVLSLPLTRHRAVPGAAAPAGGGGVRDGLRWLLRHRVLRTLVVVVTVVAAADSAWFATFVLYAQQQLGLAPLGFGVLLGTGAVGGVAGSLLADRILAGRHHRAVVGWSTAVAAGVPAMLLAGPHLWSAVAVIVLTSAAFAVVNVTAVSLRQRLTPQALLGRVTATSSTVVLGGTAAGALLGGVLAGAAGVRAPFLFCAAAACVATPLWWAATRPAATGGAWPLGS